MIETRTISLQGRTTRRTKVSVGDGKVSAHKLRCAREERERHEYHYAGGLTRCSRCPPQRTRTEPVRYCTECASINSARQRAGLVRPPGDQRPSTDNIINPLVVGKYRGPSIARRYKDIPQPVVTAFIEKLGGGWRRGVAMLNGRRVFEGKPTRSQDAAWDYASTSVRHIRTGLNYESSLADQGVL